MDIRIHNYIERHKLAKMLLNWLDFSYCRAEPLKTIDSTLARGEAGWSSCYFLLLTTQSEGPR